MKLRRSESRLAEGAEQERAVKQQAATGGGGVDALVDDDEIHAQGLELSALAGFGDHPPLAPLTTAAVADLIEAL
jgi:hypothetical protein